MPARAGTTIPVLALVLLTACSNGKDTGETLTVESLSGSSVVSGIADTDSAPARAAAFTRLANCSGF